ncbi:hypothetical protein KAR91_11690 [Candidatus Pacearchaeota archaeon]|nr:hypothetical protein [Candidatus Pacearchaeota archaeon]
MGLFDKFNTMGNIPGLSPELMKTINNERMMGMASKMLEASSRSTDPRHGSMAYGFGKGLEGYGEGTRRGMTNAMQTEAFRKKEKQRLFGRALMDAEEDGQLEAPGGLAAIIHQGMEMGVVDPMAGLAYIEKSKDLEPAKTRQQTVGNEILNQQWNKVTGSWETKTKAPRWQVKDGKGKVTPAQDATNIEIDQARSYIKKSGVNKADLIKRTQESSKTGRTNPDYDPTLARAWGKASQRKTGEDPSFENFYRTYTGGEDMNQRMVRPDFYNPMMGGGGGDSRLLGAAPQAPAARAPIAQAAPKAPVRKLDRAIATQLLKEAGGNKEKARKLARERGYSF